MSISAAVVTVERTICAAVGTPHAANLLFISVLALVASSKRTSEPVKIKPRAAHPRDTEMPGKPSVSNPSHKFKTTGRSLLFD